MFQRFEKILCPVDFSSYSDLAVKYAAVLASKYEAQLIVCHTIPDLTQVSNYAESKFIQIVTDTLLSGAKEKLQEYTSRLIPKDVPFMQEVFRANAQEMILDLAQKEGADLIVMGTHGYSGYDKHLIGSVTNRVLHRCSIPVLAVCNPKHQFILENTQNALSIKRILCALDEESGSRKIAQMGAGLARSYGSKIHFLRVLGKEEESKEREQIHLMRETAGLEGSEIETHFNIRYGEPGHEILTAAERYNIDLVIMGHHTRKPLEEYLLGSVTKRVIPDCICPVLVVRSAADLLSDSETEKILSKFAIRTTQYVGMSEKGHTV